MHLNCGLHDLKRFKKDGHHQIELDRYEENLRRIVARIREGTDAALVFADTTPILDDRHAKRGANFDRTEADVRRYNDAAIEVMEELGVPVHDLHWVVEQGGAEKMLGRDGTHYTADAYDRLAEAVADCVLRQLTIHRYRPLAIGALSCCSFDYISRGVSNAAEAVAAFRGALLPSISAPRPQLSAQACAEHPITDSGDKIAFRRRSNFSPVGSREPSVDGTRP